MYMNSIFKVVYVFVGCEDFLLPIAKLFILKHVLILLLLYIYRVINESE